MEENISRVFLIKDIIKFLSAILLFLIIFLRSIKYNFKLSKNLGRNVMVVSPKNNMEKEISVLKKSKLFKLGNALINDFYSIDNEDLKKVGAVILGYSREMECFDDFLNLIKRNNKPLIIYTFELGYNLKDEHLKQLKSYKWFTLSSTPLRLVSDLFTVMSSYDNE